MSFLSKKSPFLIIFVQKFCSKKANKFATFSLTKWSKEIWKWPQWLKNFKYQGALGWFFGTFRFGDYRKWPKRRAAIFDTQFNFFRLVKRSPSPQFFGFGRPSYYRPYEGRSFGGFGGRHYGRGRGRGRGLRRLIGTGIVVGGAALAGAAIGNAITGGQFGK